MVHINMARAAFCRTPHAEQNVWILVYGYLPPYNLSVLHEDYCRTIRWGTYQNES